MAARIRGSAVAFFVAALASPFRATAVPADPGSIPVGAPGFEIALSGRWERTQSGRRSAAGLLTVTIPLERLATPSLSQPPNPGAPTQAPDTSPSAATVPPGGPAAPRAAPTDPATRRARLSILLDAGLAQKTVRAALRAAGFGRNSRRLDSLAARAKASAVLPDLRLRGGRSTDESIRWSPTADDPQRFTQAGSAELFFDIQLTWRLDRLVFHSTELRVEQLRRQRALAKARLVQRVLDALFAWQRARTKLADATLLPEEEAEVALRQIEAEAVLDVLTAGWFTRQRE